MCICEVCFYFRRHVGLHRSICYDIDIELTLLKYILCQQFTTGHMSFKIPCSFREFLAIFQIFSLITEESFF